MHKKKRKTAKGLKVLLIITFIFLALFIASFLTFAGISNQANDPALKDFGEALKYHINGFEGLFTFKFHEGSNIFYVILSGLLYGIIAIFVIFLIVGIVVASKRKRAIIVAGIIAMLFVPAVYLFAAAGTPKYWLIVNRFAPFENVPFVLVMTYALLITGAVYIILSFISYFACIVEAFKKTKAELKAKEEAAEEAVVFEEVPAEEVPAPAPALAPVIEEIKEPEKEKEPAPILEEPAEEPLPTEPIEEDKVIGRPDSGITKEDLAELIRTIVKEEMSHHVPPQSPYGPGPLVVQYFGAVPMQQMEQPKPVEPAPKKEPEPEKKTEPAPVVEEAKEEPLPEPAPVVEEIKEEPVSEPEPEPAPEVIPEPVEEVKEEVPAEPAPAEPAEKNKIIRIPFQTRMINADEEMKKNYNELKNEILSYGVNSRVSNSGDAFRLHRKTYVKITIAGLSLKLYFALDPKDYKDSPLPIQDAGHKGIYAEIPLVFKVKSGLSMRRAKELIQTVMEKDGFEQGPIADTDWVEKLKEEPVEAEEAKED